MKHIKSFKNWGKINEVGVALKYKNQPINFIEKPVEIRMDIEAVPHALDRLYRHGVEVSGNQNQIIKSKITKDDVTETIEKAMEEITIRLMQGEFNIDDRFIITNKENSLNIVCKLESGEQHFTLIVITVMIKDNFLIDPGQFRVVV